MGHGGMNCQLKTARLIMIVINVIIFLTGATLLGAGIDLLISRRFHDFTDFISIIEIHGVDVTTYKHISDEVLYIIMIIPGLIIMFIGFFGCSGSITQIQCLLFSYSWLIGILLIFQTLLIVSLITFRSKLQAQLISSIRLFIRDRYMGPLGKNLSSTSFLWDLIMYHLKCCGVESRYDFNETNKWNRTNPWWNSSMPIEDRSFKYPLSCCPISKDRNLFDRAISCAINGSDVYDISCPDKFIDILQSIEGTIEIIVLFILIIEIFALTFVLVIYNRNRINRILHVMEELPPEYSSRTRVNNSNLYFQI